MVNYAIIMSPFWGCSPISDFRPNQLGMIRPKDLWEERAFHWACWESLKCRKPCGYGSGAQMAGQCVLYIQYTFSKQTWQWEIPLIHICMYIYIYITVEVLLGKSSINVGFSMTFMDFPARHVWFFLPPSIARFLGETWAAQWIDAASFSSVCL